MNKCWHTEEQRKICEDTPEGKSWGQTKLIGHTMIEIKAQERKRRGEIWILLISTKMYVVWAEVMPML